MLKIATILLIFFWSLYIFSSTRVDIFDKKIKDTLFLSQEKRLLSSPIIIVDIDEKSLEKYGQWPWSRELVAKLIEKLAKYQVGVIGLDVIFSEADTHSRRLKNSFCPDSGDLALAKVFQSSPVIGGYFFFFDLNSTTKHSLSLPLIVIERGSQSQFIPKAKSIKLNIPCLQESLYSSGFFNNIPDSDGVVRRVPLLIRYKNMIYPSLALEMIRVFEGVDKIVVNSIDGQIESITVGSRDIAVDRFARLIVNFRGGAKSFEYISAKDILEDRVSKSKLEGKFILIGTSAVGLSDIRPTPTDNLMAGVEVHANVIDNILNMDMINSSIYIELIDLATIFLVILLGVGVGYLLDGVVILPTFIAIVLGFFYLSRYIFLNLRLDINIFLPLLALVASIFIAILMKYLKSTKEIKELKSAFAKKVSKAVMREILKNPNRDILSSSQREVTVLFSDIRAFTTISESIKEPQKVISLLNSYFTPMVDNITSYEGTVDKFIGDAIMAYWNAPIEIKNHPDKALSCALEQIEALNGINEYLKIEEPEIYRSILEAINQNIKDPKLKYTKIINIGIGINSGVATIGEMGAVGRSDYTVIGDSVNLASRLEGLCKVYGASIIISEFTKSELTKEFKLRELDFVKVKGKTQAIKIYEALNYNIDENELKRYYKALKLYQDANFYEAYCIFDSLLKVTKSSYRLYLMYRDRCYYLKSNPPKEWRGIFEFNEK